MNLDNWPSILYVVLSFFAGIIVALWRAFTIVNRVSLIEQKMQSLEASQTNLINKLDKIDDKLDHFIVESLKNVSK
jgi:hypothetical protein